MVNFEREWSAQWPEFQLIGVRGAWGARVRIGVAGPNGCGGRFWGTRSAQYLRLLLRSDAMPSVDHLPALGGGRRKFKSTF